MEHTNGKTGDTPKTGSALAHQARFDPQMRDKNRLDRHVALCERMIDIAAAFFAVDSRDVRDLARSSSEVARVRQVAMYVTHVVLGLRLTDIGRGFGRNRSTVMHACHLVEEMRDDADFERIVQRFEAIARAAFDGIEVY